MELYKNLVKLELPEKGTGIVTKEFIKKGDTIARWFPHDKRTIEMVFNSLDALEARLETTDAENAKFLLNIYYEERWEQDIDDLRDEYKIEPLP